MSDYKISCPEFLLRIIDGKLQRATPEETEYLNSPRIKSMLRDGIELALCRTGRAVKQGKQPKILSVEDIIL